MNFIDDYPEGPGSTLEWDSYSTQFDDRSARINYSVVRHIKPKVVVEFGARTGRCTHDILQALIRNGRPYVFKSYEKDPDLRIHAQRNLDRIFGRVIEIGEDIIRASDIPDNIDYLFIDNDHDLETTQWVFDYLLPSKVRPGAWVQIHDLPLVGEFEVGKSGALAETSYIVQLHKDGKLPLEKVYWSYEHTRPDESTWWIYKPL